MVNWTPEFLLITLNEYPERKNYVEKLLTDNALKYRTFLFNKHEVGWKGCLDSHINIYKYAEKNNLDFILVLEDNVCLSPTANLKFNSLYNIMNKNTDWDTIILGGFISPFSECDTTEYTDLYKTDCIHGTSCYAIHKRLFSKLIVEYENKKINSPIDVYLSTFRQYIFRPLIFHHRVVDSTVNTHLNSIRKLWFNPAVYSKIERWFFEGKLRVGIISTACFGCFIILFIIKGIFNS